MIILYAYLFIALCFFTYGALLPSSNPIAKQIEHYDMNVGTALMVALLWPILIILYVLYE